VAATLPVYLAARVPGVSLRPDPVARVLGVLREAEQACTAADIKRALVHAGAKRAEVDGEWPRLQKRLRHHPYVRVEGVRQQLTYRFLPSALPSPREALDALLVGGLPPDVRTSYAGIVRDALAGRAVDIEEAGRRRQARIDSLRALAELAIEVEELVANEASGRTLVQRVRSRVKRAALEPVERAGEETAYDRKRHKPIGGSIADGATVVVVRPGYLWRSDDGDVVISRPVVEE
jgi:hypothetical protein